MSKIIYTGIFFDFDDQDREKLIKLARAEGMPNVFLHHVTLQFRPTPDSEHLMKVLEHEGMDVEVKVVGVAVGRCLGSKSLSYGVAALAVELSPELTDLGIDSANAVPHLTVATREGVKPFEANNALYTPLDEESQFIITGTLGAFRGGQQCHTS